MRADFKHNAFLAGEMSVAFEARTDLAKYDLGLALCNNFFVDFRGGVRTRGGLEFEDYAAGKMKMLEFKLGAGTSSIIVVATDLRFRFMSEGQYLTETPVVVASIVGTTINTSTPHGLAAGNLVVLSLTAGSAQTYKVVSTPTGSSLTVCLPNGSVAVVPPASTAVAEVKEVVTPYLESEVGAIHTSQDYLTLRLFHLSHYPQELSYDLVTQTWALAALPVGAQILAPMGLKGTPSAAGSARVVFAVSAVTAEGEESLVSAPILVTASVDYTATAGSMALEWEARNDAAFYRVYRSIVTDNASLDVRAQLGLLGETITPSLVDNNIVPDFTVTPPLHNDPFADGTVLGVSVTARGAGYVAGTTLVARDLTGSGFYGTVTLNGAGAVTGVIVGAGGSGYTNPSFYIFSDTGAGFVGTATVVGGVITAVAATKAGTGYATGTLLLRNTTIPDLYLVPVLRAGALIDVQIISGGKGATTATALALTTGAGAGASAAITTVSGASGNSPRTGMKFQQRQLYAGTTNLPNIIIGSKPTAPVNFDYSNVPNAGDSYVFALDNETIVPIKHLVRQQEGLLVLHERGIDRIKAQQGIAVTATDKYAEPQTAVGVSDVVPLRIDNDIIYSTANGAAIQVLNYTLYNNSFTSATLSILAPHLFGRGKKPVAWVWDESPDRLVWLIREDGRFLSLTYLKDQEIFAWARHETRGTVLDICGATENNETVIYFGVQRANGYFIEKQRFPDFTNIEEYFGLDAALTYTGVTQTSALGIVEANGVATITGVTLGAVGWVIRAAGGIYKITSLVATTATCTIFTPASLFSPGTTDPLAGEWSCTQEVTTVGGLSHLEGQTVAALIDGDPHMGLVVSGGSVTLPVRGSLIHVGLPYVARLETLPLFSPELQTEGKNKRIVGAQFRLENTRGLFVGMKGQDLFEMKDGSFTILDGPLEPSASVTSGLVASAWGENQRLVCEQPYPLPAAILAFIAESEFGV